MDPSTGQPMDKATFDTLVTAFGKATELGSRYEALVAAGPIPGSRAADDFARPLGDLVWYQATGALVAGNDHAIAGYELLATAHLQPMRAHASLLRGALEGAVTCCYLVERSADQGERLRRACALQFEDYSDRADFERSGGIDKKILPPPAKHASFRRTKLVQDMKRHGIARNPMAGMTALSKKYAGGAWVYQILSAFAHGRAWGLLVSDLAKVADRDEPGTRGATVMARDDVTIALTTMTMKTLTTAMGELEDYGRAASS